MDISYHGGNCIKIIVKKESIVVDGGLASIGLKDVNPKGSIHIATQDESRVSNPEGISIDGPGEYEAHGVSVVGVAAQKMTDTSDVKDATIYRLSVDGVNIAILGHVHFELSEHQLETLGVVDILVIPVGGNGYTLDDNQAANIVKIIEPKVVIPTHYADQGIAYQVPQNELELFLKELAAPHVKESHYKLGKGATLPDALTIVEITRS